jgi:hypothetical protein
MVDYYLPFIYMTIAGIALLASNLVLMFQLRHANSEYKILWDSYLQLIKVAGEIQKNQ